MRACVFRPALGFLAMFIATAAATGAGIASGQSATVSATGTLELRASLRLVSDIGACPPGINADACAPRTGQGSVSGLGRVSETYTWSYRMGPPTCPSGVGKPLATTGRLVVVGKGEVHFALADGARCIDQEPLRDEPQDFTITGGTGRYDGASGSGTLERTVNAGRGTERWIGTLVVPGLEFDVMPPTLSGATSKTVRAPKGAKRVRFTYTVTASDAVDGKVPVTCVPRPGSRFLIGRTVVRCSAADSSANTSTAKFIVTVRPRR
jgi:HYR domain